MPSLRHVLQQRDVRSDGQHLPPRQLHHAISICHPQPHHGKIAHLISDDMTICEISPSCGVSFHKSGVRGIERHINCHLGYRYSWTEIHGFPYTGTQREMSLDQCRTPMRERYGSTLDNNAKAEHASQLVEHAIFCGPLMAY
jgi:hypothetical protein